MLGLSPLKQNERADSFLSLEKWRSLAPRDEFKVLQFFADYSPQSWWSTRYLPSLRELPGIQSAFLSRTAFRTQVLSALFSTNPEYVIFHRRTLGYTVYQNSISFFGVMPIFVVPSVREISSNPTYPLNAWWDTIQAAKDGRCLLAVENYDDVVPLQNIIGKTVLVLPPDYSILPKDSPAPRKAWREDYRILVHSDASPARNLLQLFSRMATVGGPQAGNAQPISWLLSLTDGPDGIYYENWLGLRRVFSDLFGSSSQLHEPLSRESFLSFLASHIDALIYVEGEDNLAWEAAQLGIPAFCYRNLVHQVWVKDNSLERIESNRALRKQFWGGLS